MRMCAIIRAVGGLWIVLLKLLLCMLALPEMINVNSCTRHNVLHLEKVYSSPHSNWNIISLEGSRCQEENVINSCAQLSVQ